ncbi:Uncharacterised protein [Enterobacter cancerogenus]|uniref:Uncharacterized protein n=1 Tax=Enterobacter cancerogenus TaxID=69218 RepID=A0A484Z7B9_9ENTR|nr:Uncharacterised protein [Enterobacter cancerogenus]
MRNIDKRSYRADGGDIGTGRLKVIADNVYGDEEKCWLAKRVLALLDELEAKDNRINRLEAIVSVAEQRNELMREWKRALKVPCDLVDDQVPVVIHGMVIRLDRIKETEEKLEAVEKRNERALSLLKDASPENVWDVIGRLKVVIGGDYRSESEIAAAAGKGEES